MDDFLKRHAPAVEGVISGFDRLIFRGVLRSINYARGLDKFLGAHHIALKDFSSFVRQSTATLAEHAQQTALRAGRPYVYLPSAGTRKDEYAREIAERDALTTGLVCVLAVVEPCQTADLAYDRERRLLRVVYRLRKCRFFYFYYLDRDFGLIHVRLQSWLPFDLQVYVNGRLYLAQQLEREGIAFERRHNGFLHIEDYARAQALLDRLVTRAWAPTLNAFAKRVNPLLKPLGLTGEYGYYWTIRESEVATDVIFRDSAALQKVYPALTRHALAHFDSRDVIRFLTGRSNGALPKQVGTSFRRRAEGVRIKHTINENALKMYDKEGRILRIEMTINAPRRFRVLRRRHGVLKWDKMAKGIRDIARRAQVSLAANHRYLEALAVVGDPTPSHRILDAVSRPVTRDGRRYRALRPVSPEDSRLLEAILAGEGFVDGFTNRHVQDRLFPEAARTPQEARRRAGYVSRKLRLFRVHGLLTKVSGRNLYRLKPHGHLVATTALAFRRTDLALLAFPEQNASKTACSAR